MCSPKTMIKYGAVIAVPLVLGFVFLPQLRAEIIGIAPLALFAICPLMMLFGMKGVMSKNGHSCSDCKHNHTKEKVGEEI